MVSHTNLYSVIKKAADVRETVTKSNGEAEDVKSLNSTQTSDNVGFTGSTFYKVVEPSDISGKTILAYPHTVHYLASGEIMVSCLGDKDGKVEGNGFLLLDSDFNVKGRWEKPGHSPLFGYDYWYQPRHKTMINISWGTSAAFTQGFNL
nr:selenium-binding protein 1-like [Tanacetum cinerariifolium]